MTESKNLRFGSGRQGGSPNDESILREEIEIRQRKIVTSLREAR